MPCQAKTGDVGQGMHAVQFGEFNAGFVELGGDRDHARVALGIQHFLLQCCRQNADAKRLAQNQHITGFRARIFLHA